MRTLAGMIRSLQQSSGLYPPREAVPAEVAPVRDVEDENVDPVPRREPPNVPEAEHVGPLAVHAFRTSAGESPRRVHPKFITRAAGT
jgi:hypothetical protein